MCNQARRPEIVALHSDVGCVCAKVSVGIGGSFARRRRVAAGMRSRRAGLVTDEGRVVGDALAVCDAFERRAGGLAVAADGLAADGRAAAHLALCRWRSVPLFFTRAKYAANGTKCLVLAAFSLKQG